MAELTPQQIVDKQIRNTSNATDAVEAGVKNVKTAPTAAAAEQVDKAVENYRASADKMRSRLRAVSLQDWQSKTIANVNRIPQGIEAARSGLVKFHGQRQQHQQQINQRLSQMPSKSLQDSIRRMTTQVQGMAEFQFDPSQSG